MNILKLITFVENTGHIKSYILNKLVNYVIIYQPICLYTFITDTANLYPANDSFTESEVVIDR